MPPLDRPLRATIVGCGLMGAWHARYAVRCGAAIASVVDPDAAKAAALAAEFPGAVARAALDPAGVDIAHVCAPSGAHFQLCSAALQSGLHVLVEKPAAETAPETELLVAAAERVGKQFGVALQLPFQQGFQDLLRNRDALGDPVRVEFRAATAGADGLDSAGRRRVLREILPHPLSVFAALFGPGALQRHWRIDRSDDQELELSAEQAGSRWLISLSLRARPRTLELDWRGEAGRAEVDFYHGYAVFHRGRDTRVDKAMRPFVEAGSGVGAASGNLVRRAWRGEAAYPGLPELISRFYATVAGGPALLPPETLLGVARVVDAVSAG